MKTSKQFIKRRRLLLLFWSSILLTSVLIIGETFSASTTYVATETSEVTQGFEYVGPETCKTCHSEQYDAWNETGHAEASTLVPGKTNNATYAGGACYSCHTNSTAGADYFGVTTANEPVYEGVSCETCHGPYQGGAGLGHMPVTISAEFCGQCHSPFHEWSHGNAFEAWNMSAHSNSRETLLEGGFEQPRCVHCMTGEGAVPWPLGGVDTLAETENPITCAVCHDPHSAEHEHSIREAEVDDLCITCHSHESKDTPHALQGADCATCHMYGWAQDYKGDWLQVTNHTMGVWVEACGQCHADPDAAWADKNVLQAEYEEAFSAGEAKVEVAHEAFDEANATAGADPAKLTEAATKLEELDDLWHDVELTGRSSKGFHDSEGIQAMIDEAIQEAEAVIQLSEEAMKPPETTPVSETGIQLLAVLGLGITLLVAALRRQRTT
ncbi:MAG: ammonia-forming cytochrome c nitrite reductase subunit c552 [Candidatus Heimdallarchaeota archaeon]